jgi:hypothetical protein
MYFHLLNKNLKDPKIVKGNQKHLIIDLVKNEIKFTEKDKKPNNLKH